MGIRHLLVLALILTGCIKQKNKAICSAIKNARAQAIGPITIGEDLKIFTDDIEDAQYDWNGPKHFSSYHAQNFIPAATLANEGWYYLQVSNNTCDSKIDSVYVDVKLKQGSPTCSVTQNTCTFNNLAGDSYFSVERSYESTYPLFISLAGHATTTTLHVYFHQDWKGKEPEDGVYTTVNVPSFDDDGNYDEVYVSTIKNSIYFASHAGQPVYVSHVNGKLQVRFCDLSMGGNNGMSYTTIASANLVEP